MDTDVVGQSCARLSAVHRTILPHTSGLLVIDHDLIATLYTYGSLVEFSAALFILMRVCLERVCLATRNFVGVFVCANILQSAISHV